MDGKKRYVAAIDEEGGLEVSEGDVGFETKAEALLQLRDTLRKDLLEARQAVDQMWSDLSEIDHALMADLIRKKPRIG